MVKTLPVLLLLPALILAALSVPSGSAAAPRENLNELELWADSAEEIQETPGFEDPDDVNRKWSASVGIVGGFAPDYEGSNDYEFAYSPNLGFSWRDLIFFKGRTLGINLLRRDGFKAGLIGSWTGGRSEDENDKLEGLGDVDSSIEAGGFATYRYRALRLRLEARQDVNSGHDGALVDLSCGVKLPKLRKPPVLATVGLTWASEDYMESFFGVDQQQSIASGLRPFDAEAGIKEASLRLSSGYPLSRHWRIGGKLEYKRLLGDAADSPIVDDKNQFIAGLGLSYHFGSKVRDEKER